MHILPGKQNDIRFFLLSFLFDKKNILPLKFIRDINEGGYTKDLSIIFDHNSNKAISSANIEELKKVVGSSKALLIYNYYKSI